MIVRSTELSRARRAAHAAVAHAILAFAAAAAFGQLPPPPVPPGNPQSPAKIRLGKALFWDEQLSSPRTVSCGTCHIPSAGGGDPRSAIQPIAVHPGADGLFGGADDVLGSPGVPRTLPDGSYTGSVHFGFREQPTGRRTVSSINAGYSPELFWDGRAANAFVDPVTSAVVLPAGAALESQAVGPLVNDVEMAHVGRTWGDVIARVAASTPLAIAAHAPAALLDWIDGRSYAQLFLEAFGTSDITAPRIAMAIASYERTQFTAQTPFDDFLSTGDLSFLTPLEQDGFDVFNSSNCNACHSGALFSNNTFRFTGVRPGADDIGREAVTAQIVDRGRMRVPSLRNLEARAPFMRNGRFATIEAVVDFYDRGGDFVEPNLDPAIQPLNLTPQEKLALAAFLKRPLTDPRLANELPPFDRPTLYTETDRVPIVEPGGGVAGSGGIVPSVVALEPPYLGNPGFTVAVHGGLGGANALLVVDDDLDPGTTPPGSGDFAFEAVVLGGSGNGAGFASVSIPIPDLPMNLDRDLFGRWYVTDPGAAGGSAVSPLFTFRIFPPLEDTIVFVDSFEKGNSGDWSSTVP